MPSSCHPGLSAAAESWRKWGVWNASCVCPCFCPVFLFLFHTITDNESRLAAWVSFLSAAVISICCVSCLFSTNLLCLGSNLPGSDKFQEKPILIELFSECYANMSKLCGSQFHSKIWFWLHVNSNRNERWHLSILGFCFFLSFFPIWINMKSKPDLRMELAAT